MKRLLFPILILKLTVSLLANEKPNVLFVISDDLSYTLSGLGHPECKTPNLDKFAKSAVTFTRAYCQFPLCSPSRASIMSGQYPDTNGVTGNGGSLKPDRVTLPKHFQNHGYWTGRVSKVYHMGIPADILEGKPGRDHAPSWNVAYNIMAMESMTPGKIVDYLTPDAPKVFTKERKVWQKAYDAGTSYKMHRQARSQFAVVEVADRYADLLVDTKTTDQAIKILNQRKNNEQPFFLAVGFVRPHFPFIATDSAISQYNADELSYPTFPDDDYEDIPPQAINARMVFPEQSIKELRRGYFGSVSYMDQQFGRLIEELNRTGFRENTIVVFVSDHGYLIGEHEMHKKSKLWEEAIHVPLMISVPGLHGGNKCDRFVELVDLYPTLTELAGLTSDPDCQGMSLVSLIETPNSTRESRLNAFIKVSSGYGLRMGKWAYMWYPAKKKDPESAMLYDMESDPKQFTNLINLPEYALKVKQLHAMLRKRIVDAANQ